MYYNEVFKEGALTEREKALIALAVAHAFSWPYCIDAYSTTCLEKGADQEQMMEAVHVAAAMKAGNLPISRFLEYLLTSGNYQTYMQLLVNAFNPATIDGLMCRNTISVSWDGYLYDCDFNQMLDLKVNSHSQHISEFEEEQLATRAVVVNQLCFGCTAGAGSSCGGEIVQLFLPKATLGFYCQWPRN